MIITFKNDEDIILFVDTSKLTSIYIDTVNGKIFGLDCNNNKIPIYCPYIIGEDGQFYSYKGIVPEIVVEKDLHNQMEYINRALEDGEDRIILKYN